MRLVPSIFTSLSIQLTLSVVTHTPHPVRVSQSFDINDLSFFPIAFQVDIHTAHVFACSEASCKSASAVFLLLTVPIPIDAHKPEKEGWSI
jgi:hypothetical protein